jgi:NAD(P)-dependent dehydrogenase (short-subunit alcohol dehydrogenase family)
MTTRYVSVHQSPNGPGDQRPTASQIVADEQLQGKWSDKTVLITGCSSGLGIETAKSLFETGATLYLTARDLKKAKSALGSLEGSERVHLLELDLNSLASVRKCADSFLAHHHRLNILIANAGIMACPEGRTMDGFEMQFGTNHLAHFLLIQILLPTLVKSSTPEFKSRVVMLASIGHRMSGIHLDNLNLEGEYHPWTAYGQSKTANMYTATELNRRYGDHGVHAWSVHPGLIFTGLMTHIDKEMMETWDKDPNIGKALKSPQQGAATTVWAATAQALEGQGGKYLEECQVSMVVNREPTSNEPGYAPHAYDEEKEKLLWEKSLELVKPFMV